MSNTNIWAWAYMAASRSQLLVFMDDMTADRSRRIIFIKKIS